MLKAVTRKKDIAKCQNMLESALKAGLPNNAILSIGHPGDYFDNTVYYGKGLWFSTQILTEKDVPVPRYWNGFGLGKREDGNQIIIVEINPALEGFKRQVSGLFAKDHDSGAYFILHSGRVGGGRKGIGKTAFEGWYRGTWTNVMDDIGNSEKMILVGSLKSPGLLVQIKDFVSEVAKFKEEVSSGVLSRSPKSKDKALSFNPEFHGKKSGRRTSKFEYDTYHGLVVAALEEKFKRKYSQESYTAFNTKLIDLGIEKDKTLEHIFEVKTSTDSQSIYAGIGQLMFHSLGSLTVKKTLVLPSGKSTDTLAKILHTLDIEILFYEIVNRKVTFAV